MEKYLKKYTINSLLISVLLIIFSIFLMVKPTESITFIVIMFSGVVAIDGIFHIISYFSVPKELKFFNFELIEGISQLILGILTMLKPEWVSAFFPMFIGMWIIFSSIVKFQFALNIKQTGNVNWIIILTFSIITFLLGLLMVINPIGSIITITTLCGIVLFIAEILNVIQYIIFILKI